MNLRDDGSYNNALPLNKLVDHVDYIVERIGIDHVGFGSDFDGADVPDEMGNVTGLQKLIQTLRERGYGEAALEKITYRNWLRVLAKTWKEDL